jgi:hypothetical protein
MSDAKLLRYEAACRAIAAARSIDEVKKIRDAAVAMRAYARIARNKEIEADAVEIRMRAMRRLDEMREQQKATIGLATGADASRARVGKQPELCRPTLASQGVDKYLAHQSRQLGPNMLDEEQFEKVIGEARRAVVRVPLTVISAGQKKQRRDDREMKLAAKQVALPEQKFGVILADPEWRFEPWSRETGMDRAAENHYATSEICDIKARDVLSIAADDCVLYLWAIGPLLPQALEVMLAWGFTYKSHAIWRKDKMGLGYWFRFRHELLLVGTRGTAKTGVRVP